MSQAGARSIYDELKRINGKVKGCIQTIDIDDKEKLRIQYDINNASYKICKIWHTKPPYGERGPLIIYFNDIKTFTDQLNQIID